MSELRVERMVHGGVGLARLESGRLVLVTGALPGELVRARVEEISGVLRADTSEILEASPERLPAPEHPGLDYGHIRYPAQLRLKRDVVVDALGRALRDVGLARELVAEVRPAPSIWRYRSAIQPVASRLGLGYREPGSSSQVLLPADPVANAGAARAWEIIAGQPIPKGVREVAIRGNDRGEALVALVAASSARSLLEYAHRLVDAGLRGVAYAKFDPRGRFRGGSERLAGARRMYQRYGDFELSVTATSFAQPNPGAAGELYRDLADLAGEGGTALELFAGSGAIAMHLAGAFRLVEAVEIDRGSVVRGEEDASRLGFSNVVFSAGDVRRWGIPDDVELIAVDPPRSGLGQAIRERIDESRAKRLLYVSCDPATWARDVAHFRGSGWTLQVARPYDFYPHTHHVEMLSLLVR